MTSKVACEACGAMILPDTAERTGGLCMPCKGGYRKNIEASKLRYEQQKRDRESPASKHWVWLVNQVYGSEGGFASLSPENQYFFAALLVEGEVYNGGFDQYFYNSSADYFSYAIEGFAEMGALECRRLLLQAKQLYFGEGSVPGSQVSRIDYLRATSALDEMREKKVDEIDRMFYLETDNFQQRAAAYARKHRLYADF